MNDLLEICYKLNIKINIKVHFLFSYLNTFPESVGAVSDETGFHQDRKVMEMRYQDRLDAHMMANHC